MTALAPVDAASCRAMAVECGRRADEQLNIGNAYAAGGWINRARELCILALKFEAEESHSLPLPPVSATDMPGEVVPQPASPGANSSEATS